MDNYTVILKFKLPSLKEALIWLLSEKEGEFREIEIPGGNIYKTETNHKKPLYRLSVRACCYSYYLPLRYRDETTGKMREKRAFNSLKELKTFFDNSKSPSKFDAKIRWTYKNFVISWWIDLKTSYYSVFDEKDFHLSDYPKTDGVFYNHLQWREKEVKEIKDLIDSFS